MCLITEEGVILTLVTYMGIGIFRCGIMVLNVTENLLQHIQTLFHLNCVGRVERALNTLEGVQVMVTLDPPVATIEYDGEPLSVEELQQILTEKAGDYQISE